MGRWIAVLFGFVFMGPAAFAQSGIECKLLSGPQVFGSGAHPESVKSVVQASPEDLAGGYRVTGAWCQQLLVNNPTAAYGYTTLAPLDPNAGAAGYACEARAEQTPGKPTVTAGVMAQAIACKTASAPVAHQARFTSDGLGGGIVIVGRRSGEYTAPIPFSVRLCNVAGASPMADIGVYFGVGSDPAAYKIVPVGQCLELDQPKAVFFHTPNAVAVVASGTYELFAPGTFSRVAVSAAKATVPAARYARVSNDHWETATCQRPSPDDPVGKTVNASYWAYCKAPGLVGGKNYRVCFETGYSNQAAGLDDYPGPLLPMVLDAASMTQPFGNDGYHYNSLAPGGCRDLFAVNEAYFLVVGPLWENQPVDRVTYRVMQIQ